jgi:hypothetical protein
MLANTNYKEGKTFSSDYLGTGTKAQFSWTAKMKPDDREATGTTVRLDCTNNCLLSTDNTSHMCTAF